MGAHATGAALGTTKGKGRIWGSSPNQHERVSPVPVLILRAWFYVLFFLLLLGNYLVQPYYKSFSCFLNAHIHMIMGGVGNKELNILVNCTCMLRCRECKKQKQRERTQGYGEFLQYQFENKKRTLKGGGGFQKHP